MTFVFEHVSEILTTMMTAVDLVRTVDERDAKCRNPFVKEMDLRFELGNQVIYPEHETNDDRLNINFLPNEAFIVQCICGKWNVCKIRLDVSTDMINDELRRLLECFHNGDMFKPSKEMEIEIKDVREKS